MKHAPNNRRSRRQNGRRGHQNVRNQTFESNGPEGRIRGTAQQVLEKYLALGRDASSAGEHIQAEAFYQHAEHYFRLLNSDPNYQNRQGDQRRPTPADSDPNTYDDDERPPNPQPVQQNQGGKDDSQQGQEPAGLGEQPDVSQPDQAADSKDGGGDGDDNGRGRGRRRGGNGAKRIPIEQGEADADSGAAEAAAGEASGGAQDSGRNGVPDAAQDAGGDKPKRGRGRPRRQDSPDDAQAGADGGEDAPAAE